MKHRRTIIASVLLLASPTFALASAAPLPDHNTATFPRMVAGSFCKAWKIDRKAHLPICPQATSFYNAASAQDSGL